MADPLRYYADEHIHSAVAEGLRQRGIGIVMMSDVDRAGRGISDADQLTYAMEHGRVLITQDRDFITLAVTNIPHSGVILLQKVLSIGDTIAYLELVAHLTAPDEIRDHLLFCDW